MFVFLSAGHPCSFDPSVSQLAPYVIAGTPQPTIEVGTAGSYNVSCPNGWVFDYVNGYNSAGRSINPRTVECPPYVQGEPRAIPPIDENDFVCLRECLELYHLCICLICST